VTPDTVSVADATLLAPPAPLQINAYDVVVLTAPVLCVPLVGNAPAQPSDAVHDVALLEVQVRVDVSPDATTEGLTVNVAVGTTLTTAVASEVPPGPAHASEYAVALRTAPVLLLPLVPTAPLQPPDAVHDVASVEVQARMEAPPEATSVGVAVSSTVGRGFTVTVAVAAALIPPGPVHVKENTVVVVNTPVLCVPLPVSAPLHPPEALQDVALVEVHVSVAESPAAIVVGDALIDTAGGRTTAGWRTTGLEAPPPHADSASAGARIKSQEVERTTPHPDCPPVYAFVSSLTREGPIPALHNRSNT
jgi:hypothetical protein